MPRYNIRLTASNGETRPRSRRIWATDTPGAIAWAKSWLAVCRNTSRAGAGLDTWEVSIDVAPYTKVKVVVMGHFEARQ